MLSLRAATATSRKSLQVNIRRSAYTTRRGLLTLAIETSCDDTSVAIVDKTNSRADILFLENITCDSTAYRGIHPVCALQSHQANLAKLTTKALARLPFASGSETNPHKLIPLPDGNRQKPDFISVTRGPGMRSNLNVGLDTAKGLSVAWQIPLVGVHHMQAHLLTPRLVSALSPDSPNITPEFPFFSILASGGHTILTTSTSLTAHSVLATTNGFSIGKALDTFAREVVPESLLATSKNTMYGKLLEQWAFPNGPADYADYTAARTRGEEMARSHRDTGYEWTMAIPLVNTRDLALSFAHLHQPLAYIQTQRTIADEERVALAREGMRTCFEHVGSRTIIALESLARTQDIRTLVVSGGVAANQFFRRVLRSFLDVRGFEHVRVVAPPPALCTDNAAMIGWAGIEMFEAGWRSDLSVEALRRWSLDAESGGKGEREEQRIDDEQAFGVLGARGWVRV
ncbi:glycoprotease family protein [Aspergillus egyptiacus]|nr:glycoprotease family protein [Aspergillus egyptiacus]